MLSAAQKAKCSELARSLDRGETEAYQQADASWMTPEARMYIWEERKDFTIWAARGRELAEKARAEARANPIEAYQQVVTSVPRKPALPKTNSWPDDLDFWSDADPREPDDDDDPPPTCGACGGSGRGRDGSVCGVCGGKGRIPAEDMRSPDDDDNDDEIEDD